MIKKDKSIKKIKILRLLLTLKKKLKGRCHISDRLNELRLENRRLQSQIEELEHKILALVGNIEIESSGEANNKEYLNNKIIEFINSTKDQLNIVTPKMDEFYMRELKKLAKNGIPVLIITIDRHSMIKPYQKIYDELTNTPGISVINNPNVRYLLVFTNDLAIYSGGSLDRDELSKSVLIVTIIKERQKLRKIAEIFSAMLPSFMR